MNYIDRAIESSTRYLFITNKSDPASLGIQRENAAIAITGIFGVTCKTVIQRHLELSREAVNKLINRLKKNIADIIFFFSSSRYITLIILK